MVYENPDTENPNWSEPHLIALELNKPDGGYFLGAGNWVASYILIENYLAMLQAGREFSLPDK